MNEQLVITPPCKERGCREQIVGHSITGEGHVCKRHNEIEWGKKPAAIAVGRLPGVGRPPRRRSRRVSVKADRRARKRARRDLGADARYWAALPAYIRSRIVCDKCGLEQPFRVAAQHEELAPCDGPLGLACDSETAVWADSFEFFEAAA